MAHKSNFVNTVHYISSTTVEYKRLIFIKISGYRTDYRNPHSYIFPIYPFMLSEQLTAAKFQPQFVNSFSVQVTVTLLGNSVGDIYLSIPTPPLGQDMTQGQFLSGV